MEIAAAAAAEAIARLKTGFHCPYSLVRIYRVQLSGIHELYTIGVVETSQPFRFNKWRDYIRFYVPFQRDLSAGKDEALNRYTSSSFR